MFTKISQIIHSLLPNRKTGQENNRVFSALNRDNLSGLRAVSDLIDAGKEAVTPLLDALPHSSSQAKQSISLILGKLQDQRAVEPLSKLLEEKDWQVRSAAAIALSRLGAVETLALSLKSNKPEARQMAIFGLGMIGDARVIPALMEALGDPNVRTSAAGKLKDIAPLQCAPVLRPFLASEDIMLQSYAFDALAAVSVDEVIEAAHEILPDTSVKARSRLADKLGRLGDKRAVAMLVSLLGDPDHSVRQTAIDRLGGLKRAEAFSPSLALLNDPDMQVRRSAAWALGRLGDWRATAPLMERLTKDEEPRVRRSAAAGLGVLGNPLAVESLIVAVHDSDEQVRIEVAEALGKLGDDRGLEPLLGAMDIPTGGWRVAQALAKLGGKAIVPQLIEALASEHRGTRQVAISALGYHLRARDAVESLLKLLDSPDKNTRLEAGAALGWIGDERALPALLKLVNQQSEVHASLIYSLCRFKHEAVVTALTRLLKMDDWTCSASAIGLGYMGDQRAVEPLIELLRDSTKARRFEAARALGHLKDARAIEPLLELVDADEPKPERGMVSVRPYVVWALGEMRVVQAVPKLVDLLHVYNNLDYNDMSIVEALGKIGDSRAVPELIRTLDQQYESCRVSAVWALGEIGDKRAVKPLLKVAASSSPFIRYYAIRALSRLADPRAFELVAEAALSRNHEMHRFALVGLSQMNDMRALHIFLDYLSNDRHGLRKIALNGLVRLGSTALPVLLDALSDSDRPVRYRRMLVRALGLIKDEQALPQLISCLQSELSSQVRAEAAHALGRIGVSGAGIALTAALDSSASNVRAAAVTALGQLRIDSSRERVAGLLHDPNRNVRYAAHAALRRLSA